MKSTSDKEVRQWGTKASSDRDFRLFYISGELMKLLDELASESEQAELIASLVRQEHERRYARRD